MRAAAENRERLEAEALRIAGQLRALGAVQVIVFGSLARGQISLSCGRSCAKERYCMDPRPEAN